MRALLTFLAVLLAVSGLLVAFSMPAGASMQDATTTSASDLRWCVTPDAGESFTARIGDTHGIPLIDLLDTANGSGSLWLVEASDGKIYSNNGDANNPPAHVGDSIGGNGATVTSVTHYTVRNGACEGGSQTTTELTTTTAPTTTTTPPPPPADAVYICESNSQTNPSVETKKLAKKLWDKGNWIPYATTVALGSTRIGGGYSLICNPLHYHLKLTQRRWIDDNGTQVKFLDLGQYPLVVKRSAL